MAFGDLLDTGVTTTTGIGTTVVVNAASGLSVSVAIGDLVIAVLCQQNNLTVTGVTDVLGNTYTASNAGTDSGQNTGRMFYSRVTVAGTLNTVTFSTPTGNGTDDAAGIVAVFAGPFIVSPVDANPANAPDDVTPNVCPATGTLTQPVELVVGWGTAQATGTAANALSATSVGTLAVRAGATAAAIAAIGYMVTASTASVSITFTSVGSFDASVFGTTSFIGLAGQPTVKRFGGIPFAYSLGRGKW